MNLKNSSLLALLFIFTTCNAENSTFSNIKNAEAAYQKEDYTTAYKLYQGVAKEYSPQALYQLGVMNELGLGTKQDHTQAMHYFRAAAKNGHLDAYYDIALLHEHGRGVPKNEKEAILNYQIAADKGHVRSLHNLAHLYAESNPPLKDEKKAFQYYLIASNKGFTLSQMQLANFYLGGRGCSVDDEKALSLYKTILLKEDHPEAQYNAALMIARGLGTAQNDILAYALWENNAALGDKDSAFNRDVLSKRISSEEIETAKELSKDRTKILNMIIPLKKIDISPR